MAMADGTGKRFNQGKLRLDLIPPFAQEQYAKALAFGSQKYGDDNWRKGMAWTNMIASAERHLHAIKMGEDYDPESGLLHSAHVMCNMGFLTEYYKIFPQGDNRLHSYLKRPNIGLYIDDVLSEHTKDNDTILVKTKPEDIPFEPYCYFTTRMSQTFAETWLKNNGFPIMPIYKDLPSKDIDIVVDANFENFIELNKSGICCYLFDTANNRRHNVGHKRIHSLKELYS
jgi:hypothetical protein